MPALTGISGTTGTQVGPCRGDAGGPGVRTVDGAPHLAAITHSGGAKTDAHLLQWNCNGNADQYWTLSGKARPRD